MTNQPDKFDIAHLINKFYDRYPLESFKTDDDRSFALGVFFGMRSRERANISYVIANQKRMIINAPTI